MYHSDTPWVSPCRKIAQWCIPPGLDPVACQQPCCSVWCFRWSANCQYYWMSAGRIWFVLKICFFPSWFLLWMNGWLLVALVRHWPPLAGDVCRLCAMLTLCVPPRHTATQGGTSSAHLCHTLLSPKHTFSFLTSCQQASLYSFSLWMATWCPVTAVQFRSCLL